MIHITLGAARATDPTTDELGRHRVGYAPDMDEQELYDANRAAWVLGARADDEQYSLASFGGIVRQAIAIDHIEDYPGGRRGIVGRILRPGDPVYDAFVGQPSPVGRVRNPITYVEVENSERTCRCGCGEVVTRRDFIAGHDQRAIHDRIAKVGSVSSFIDWFDRTWQD